MKAFLIRDRRGDREGQVKTDAEIGVMRLQAKEDLNPPELAKKDSPLELLEGM